MVNQQLTEALLSDYNEDELATTSPDENNDEPQEAEQPMACLPEGTDDDGGADATPAFSVKTELCEMLNLGLPLAISFFCRMGMASMDSSFVGHISNGAHSAETYLAAAVLSDMVLNICITPPLAFNQVLNALVGQAMGSGNPKMAGIWLQQSMFWLSITMLPCLVGLFHVERILLLLDFPETVAHVAGAYAKYNLIWPIPNGLYQCMRFYFQAQGLPRPAMYNNILFLVINALLNWIFVFGGPFANWNGFGFIGAAISLSISRTMQPMTYFLYMFCYKKHHLPTWPSGRGHHTAARTCEFMKQSLPNIGTLLFQILASQATTVLVGRLGELSIAASSALSTVTIPWAGALSATCSTISGVRVGYHLGNNNAKAAERSTWLVLYFVTIVTIIFSILFALPSLRPYLLYVATDDENVLKLASILVPAMLVGTWLNLLVGNITSGVFSGQGRPMIATILSFGLELPLSIGGVAIYILAMKGNLLGVYWWQAISGAIEGVVVFYLLMRSNWSKCADEAQRRQESSNNEEAEEDAENASSGDIQEPLLLGQDAAAVESDGTQ